MSSILKVDTIQNTGGTTGLTIDNNGDLTFTGSNTVTPTDSGWITPTLSGSFNNYSAPYGPVKYRKIGDIVNIQGLISNAQVGDVFVLPVGYRPDRQIIFLPNVAGGGYSRFDILQNGRVYIDVTSTSSWFSLTCTFFTA